MAKDTPNTQPSQPAQNTQNTRNVQNAQRDAPRHQGSRRYHGPSEQPPRSDERSAEKAPQETKALSLDDEETEQDRSAAQSRPSRGGGRGKPPKRVIEEWASDIYCE